MSKSITVLGSALLVLFIFCHSPAGAQGLAPRFKARADLAPEYMKFIPGQLRLDDIGDFSGQADSLDNQNGKNNGKRSRLSLNISRLAVGGGKVDPFEDDKFSRWNMLKSLPGDFADAQTYQDRLEIVGKIFEPKVTLDIAF